MTIPFLSQLVLVVGLVGWLSLQNGQKAINDMAGKLRDKSISHIEQHLEGFLYLPHQINQTNVAAMESGILPANNFKILGKYFWQQARSFNLSYINFASAKGDFLGVERSNNGDLWVNETRASSGLDKMFVYTTDRQGDRTGLREIVNNQPPIQQEAWFADAVRAGKPTWSHVYQWEDAPTKVSLSASYPIYDQNRQLVGVLGIDLLLSQISQFLQQLSVSQSGRIFIMERSGLLIASSELESPFSQQGNRLYRLNAVNSRDPLISLTTQHLAQQFNNLEQINGPTQLSFWIQGERQFVQVAPWRDRYGLDWLIVVAIPESDFMDQITSNTRHTIWLCLIALGVTACLASFTSRWLTRPILRLSHAAQAIADGQLDQLVEAPQVQELDLLSHSFNQMAKQLQDSFTALETANTTLEQRIAQQSSELLASETKFAKVFWASPNAIAITTIDDGLFIEANASFCTLMGYELEEVIGSTSYDLNCWADPGERAKVLQLLQQKGAVVDYPCQLRTKSGKILDSEISIQMIYLNEQAYLLFAGTDITDRKQAEIQVQASLREKEVLLKEVHHRVKNNLHIISNLLDLQSDQITDAALLELFAESQSRIQAMALIHEQLYQSDDLGQVDFGEYIRRLIDNLMLSYGSHLGAVAPIIQTESILLNLETAVPCGLLINELITNSFKHAFPDQQAGEVHIQLHQQSDRRIHLHVWDTGIGIPANLDWQTSPSLGLKLVRILAKQLKAKLTITSVSGTHVELIFSELKYKPRF